MEWKHASLSFLFLPSIEHRALHLASAPQANVDCMKSLMPWLTESPVPFLCRQTPVVSEFLWSIISSLFSSSLSFLFSQVRFCHFLIASFHLLFSCGHILALFTFSVTLGLFCNFPPLYFCQVPLFLLATKLKTSLWKVIYVCCWEPSLPHIARLTYFVIWRCVTVQQTFILLLTFKPIFVCVVFPFSVFLLFSLNCPSFVLFFGCGLKCPFCSLLLE